MVYLLHRYFGRDGRDEADEMLERRSGHPDKPRILEAFNQPIKDWLSFYCFTMFVDRDGKFQLGALAESGFAPLRRTTQFMLTEEAHHLFVGEMGIDRVVQRSAELTVEGDGDPRPRGGIPLEIIQRYINFWYSHALDLFGGEVSSNAADFFASGLKGRWQESKKYDEHTANDQFYEIPLLEGSRLSVRQVPLRNAMNEILRDEYIRDSERAINRWNKTIAGAGADFQLTLPSRRWHRHIGEYAGQAFSYDGTPTDDDDAHQRDTTLRLPSEDDLRYVASLMVPVVEPDKMANWVAPPTKGINGNPWQFEYVRMN
jgi:benzoyl-CoA 2,3-dioxygenase component B